MANEALGPIELAPGIRDGGCIAGLEGHHLRRDLHMVGPPLTKGTALIRAEFESYDRCVDHPS